MLRKCHNFIKNFCFITIPSVLVFVFFLEFVVFRFILPASDMPYSIKSSEDVARYLYKDYGMYNKGVFRKGFPCEIKADYNINAEGWNSPKEYLQQKTEKKRIAVIGDSFVEALTVDVDKSMAEVLEDELNKSAENNVEVYRFGFSGASLSQYLQMIRYVSKKYDPDIVVVLIIYNDFLDSIYGTGNKDGGFLQHRMEGGDWIEVKPSASAYAPDAKRMFLKNSATARYFYYNLDFKRLISFFISKLKNEDIEMNVKTDDIINNLGMIESLSYYLFSQYKKEIGDNAELILVMDANRNAIYKEKDPKKEELYALNLIAINAARELSIHFKDLNEIFIHDYKINQKYFDFKCDKHWNERTHFLAGKAISSYIQQNIF